MTTATATEPAPAYIGCRFCQATGRTGCLSCEGRSGRPTSSVATSAKPVPNAALPTACVDSEPGRLAILKSVPASDTNFQSALANSAENTLRDALSEIEGQAGQKTRTQRIKARLKSMTPSKTPPLASDATIADEPSSDEPAVESSAPVTPIVLEQATHPEREIAPEPIEVHPVIVQEATATAVKSQPPAGQAGFAEDHPKPANHTEPASAAAEHEMAAPAATTSIDPTAQGEYTPGIPVPITYQGDLEFYTDQHRMVIRKKNEQRWSVCRRTDAGFKFLSSGENPVALWALAEPLAE